MADWYDVTCTECGTLVLRLNPAQYAFWVYRDNGYSAVECPTRWAQCGVCGERCELPRIRRTGNGDLDIER